MINFKERRHINGLDGLRTLAITIITLFHIFPNTFAGGYIGVCLFLVLTGFLLAYGSACDHMSGNFNVFLYFWKRLKRLYPPLIFVILITVGAYHFLLPGTLEDVGKEIGSVLLGFNNWWQLSVSSDYFARAVNASPFTHMWFLGVELEFVVFWPILFGLCVLFKRVSILLLGLFGVISAGAMAFMSLQGVDISRLYYGTDTRVFACLFGGAMGLWFANQEIKSYNGKFLSAWYDVLFVILLIPVSIATFLLRGQYPLVYEGGMQFMTVLFCVMLFIVADNSRLGGWLENPVFKWIGGHSYEIFLWQYPVLVLFQRKGWHNLSYGPAVEIVLILILSALFKAVADSIVKFKLPFAGEDLLRRLSRFAFLSVTALSVVVMYFGARDVLASDFDPAHPPGYKMKLELERKQAELEKAQAEREARAAQEAEKIRTAQEKLAAQLRGMGITMIGDSIMLGSSAAISEIMPDAFIDAKVSRDVCEGAEVAQRLQQEGKLSDIVVVALGTNGPLVEYEPYASDMQKLLETFGTQRQIYWITVYCVYSEWMDMNNAYLTQLAQTRPNFHLVNWYPIAVSNPDLLYSDGTHPNIEGAEVYAKLIHDTLAQGLSAQ